MRSSCMILQEAVRSNPTSRTGRTQLEVRAPSGPRLPASRNISGVPRQREAAGRVSLRGRSAQVGRAGKGPGARRTPPAGPPPRSAHRWPTAVPAGRVRDDVGVGLGATGLEVRRRPRTPTTVGVVGTSYVGAAGAGSTPSSWSRRVSRSRHARCVGVGPVTSAKQRLAGLRRPGAEEAVHVERGVLGSQRRLQGLDRHAAPGPDPRWPPRCRRTCWRTLGRAPRSRLPGPGAPARVGR